jgi:hypothetical protein
VEHLRASCTLPAKDAFFSKVSNSGVSEADYAHAQAVYTTFGCKNMLDFCELYCKSDVYLLAECFISFREEVIREFELDPVHYISLPQLAFDCMLKMTGVAIECLSDIDMILFLESAVRGGVSFISQRHCEAPEPEAAQPTDPKLLYIDANNLYGYSQSCPQPVGLYRWLTDEEIQAKDWTVYDHDSDIGYILEVDLTYPRKLHKSHNSLPLAPHRMIIDETILSEFSKECLLEVKGKTKHLSTKLASTFLPRKRYVVHGANLELYLELGMVLRKVRRVLRFVQSDFLKKYIEFCTSKRAASKSEFRKRLFKTFSNSNFGKFIEKTRDHLDCHIVDSKEKFEKWTACPRYSSYKVLAPDVVAVFLKRPYVLMRQAWAIGFTILDRSKELVYRHYYKHILPALDGKCSVVFTDTDSLCLNITANLTIDEVLERLQPLMDYSNYPSTHPRFCPTRKNQLGYWKDENMGSTMVEFVGLSSKTYSMRVAQLGSSKIVSSSKCKGVGKGFRKCIPFEEYKKCVAGINQHRVNQYAIRAVDHKIRTVKMNRMCFSSFDDKRHCLPCGIHTLAYGSKFIAICEQQKRCMFCK